MSPKSGVKIVNNLITRQNKITDCEQAVNLISQEIRVSLCAGQNIEDQHSPSDRSNHASMT